MSALPWEELFYYLARKGTNDNANGNVIVLMKSDFTNKEIDLWLNDLENSDFASITRSEAQDRFGYGNILVMERNIYNHKTYRKLLVHWAINFDKPHLLKKSDKESIAEVFEERGIDINNLPKEEQPCLDL